MLDYQVLILSDKTGFEHTISGVTYRYRSIVNPKLLENCNFFVPIKKLLQVDKWNIKNCKTVLENLADIEYVNAITNYKKDNPYDISSYCIDDASHVFRISLNYINCPITSFYLYYDKDINKVCINMNPATQSYYTISSSEWKQFCNQLRPDVIRDNRLDQIFNEKANLLRQARFYNKTNGNNFLYKLLDYYDSHGKISDKQIKVIKKIIWDQG